MSEKQSSLLVDYQPPQCLKNSLPQCLKIESTVNKFTTPQVDYQPPQCLKNSLPQCLKIESTVNKFTTPQNNSHDNSRLVDCAFKYNSTQITPHRLKYQISATTMSENLQNHEATIIHINSNHEATIIHINSSSHTATVSEIER